MVAPPAHIGKDKKLRLGKCLIAGVYNDDVLAFEQRQILRQQRWPATDDIAGLALPDFLRAPEGQTVRLIYRSIKLVTLEGIELLAATPLPPNAEV